MQDEKQLSLGVIRRMIQTDYSYILRILVCVMPDLILDRLKKHILWRIFYIMN